MSSYRNPWICLVLAILATKCITLADNNFILSSPKLTDLGDWGEWDNCPDKTFVMGMRLKTEPAQGPLDDTGLNGISFLCGRLGESSRAIQTRTIQSQVGDWGSWGNSYECPNGYVLGFQLRSESHQDQRDDTAANNLRIYCSGTKGLFLEGGGLQWGEWTALQYCPSGYAICGLRTQVQSPQGSNSDDTSLNNFDAKCCSLQR